MKQAVWGGMLIGTTIGGCIPMLWGDSLLSFSSIIFTALGGFAGIYIAFKLSQ